jgi:hypothetical protein
MRTKRFGISLVLTFSRCRSVVQSVGDLSSFSSGRNSVLAEFVSRSDSVNLTFFISLWMPVGLRTVIAGKLAAVAVGAGR